MATTQIRFTTKAFFIYSVFLIILTFFAKGFLEGADPLNPDTLDKSDLEKQAFGFTRNAVEEIRESTTILDWATGAIKFILGVPMDLVAMVIRIVSLPFGAAKYMPPILSAFIYIPYGILFTTQLIIPALTWVIELIRGS